MPLVSEFNPNRIKQLHREFEAILERLTNSLNNLEKGTLRYKNSMNDKTSTEAIRIVNEYKRIIKKMQETTTESLEAVKAGSDRFSYIEDVLASQLGDR